MSGLRLEEMEATDMLDVLHYMFEEDLTVSSAEEAEAKSEARSVVYKNLYGTTYKYATPKTGRSANGGNLPSDGFYGDDQELVPFDPMNNVTKPFVPSTEFDPDSPLPFGQVLDAPLS